LTWQFGAIMLAGHMNDGDSSARGGGELNPTQMLVEDELQERRAMFRDFLTSRDDWTDGRNYPVLIRDMLKAHRTRLIVNINDLRLFNRDLTTLLLQQPVQYLPVLEKALREAVQDLNEPAFGFDASGVPLHVGLEGSFGELHTNPRHLSARLLSHMVCLDGIVTSCSLVRPKLLKSVHYSESMKTFLVKEYWDSTMLTGAQLPGSMAYPTEGDDHQKLTSEFGLSKYRDYQTVTIQEMPEKAPAGQLPRSIDVVVDDDLVDRLKPGDRAQVVGVYKSLATAFNGQVPSTFRSVIVANSVRLINRDAVAPQLSAGDIDRIRTLSRRRDVFELVARSLAPSIYGHEHIKQAVALLLLGGVERNIRNTNTTSTSTSTNAPGEEDMATSTHIRGDINLMLVGDPSTAKSQMLRFVLGIAPLAIATTGRGSSGVGLTAAVTSDKETGERRLEAGAMVLADRGIVCIDEFDKMSDTDRVAIHEVMEQQTVTIAKAGIHASLNARCSVLAAANPIWGQYRETASPQENIRLPDSLLSRFDLLFIVLDRNAPEHDRRISQHVLRMHRYVPPGLPEGAPLPEKIVFDEDEEDAEPAQNGIEGDAAIFLRRHVEDGDEEASQVLTIPFLKKYLHYARSTCVPTLTKAAADVIVAAYTDFRQQKDASELSNANSPVTAKTFPVTPRTLETLIRLATAHAKARLSARVEKKDAVVARELVEFCLYQEVKKKAKRKKAKEDSESEGEGEGEGEGEDRQDSHPTEKDSDHQPTAPPDDIWNPGSLERLSLSHRAPATEPAMSLPVATTASQPSQPSSSSLPVLSIADSQYTPTQLIDAVQEALRPLALAGTSSISYDHLRATLAIPVSVEQLEDALACLQNDNKVFFADGVVYII